MMRAPLPPLPEVHKALTLLQPPVTVSPDRLESWQGRVSEVSESGPWGALTLVMRLVVQVQRKKEQTAWIAAGDSLFSPSDLAQLGLDLTGITVIRAQAPGAALQAADWLLRSGAFGLVAVDGLTERVADAELGRLGRLAEEVGTAVVFLTQKYENEPSMGTQISLRVAVLTDSGGFQAVAVKDKRGTPGRFAGRRHGPMGLY